jgi:hypothetical protein
VVLRVVTRAHLAVDRTDRSGRQHRYSDHAEDKWMELHLSLLVCDRGMRSLERRRTEPS